MSSIMRVGSWLRKEVRDVDRGVLVVGELWCRVRATAGRVCSILCVYGAVWRLFVSRCCLVLL